MCITWLDTFFQCILLIMLLQLSHFFLPFIPLCPAPPSHQHFPTFTPCPWVIHISSLASPFPTLFLTSPCLFSTYHLCYLFSVPFPPLSPFHSPVDNPPCDLHFCGSVPVLSCWLSLLLFLFQVWLLITEFAVILLFIFFIFFFLDKSL